MFLMLKIQLSSEIVKIRNTIDAKLCTTLYKLKAISFFMSFLAVVSFSYKGFKVNLTLASQETFAGFQDVFKTSLA